MVNSNVVNVQRLLAEPVVKNVDCILASLHTTSDQDFLKHLHGKSAQRVQNNILALRKHGYPVEMNYSLGNYNKEQFDAVLEFAIGHKIPLKTIALVRSNEKKNFYGGEWIDPEWIDLKIRARGGQRYEVKDALGGQTSVYRLGDLKLKVKNIARGRLLTEYCAGCPYEKICGEGIYGLRVGTDGIWKPCLLHKEKFSRVEQHSYRQQILEQINAMIGDFSRAHFKQGIPG